MADEYVLKQISELSEALSVQSSDILAIQQSGRAKKVSIDTLKKAIDTVSYFGVCSTASDIETKTVEIDGITELYNGLSVYVFFSNPSITNTNYLKINNLTARMINHRGNGGTPVNYWAKTGVHHFTYYNNQWWADYESILHSTDLGFDFVECYTPENVLEKETNRYLSDYCYPGTMFAVRFSYNVPAGSTLKLRRESYEKQIAPKPIYYIGGPIANGIIKAHDTALFVATNSSFYLLAVDRVIPEIEDIKKSIGITEITYADLKTARNSGNLIPGAKYRITDFVTIINGTYDFTEMIGQPTFVHYAKSAEHPFDLIVTALDGSHLDEHAVATLHEGDTYFDSSLLEQWDIKYTLDNEPSIYSWADPVNGKGVITYMKDEFNNEAGYDFKNIQFLAYAMDMTDPNAEKDSLCYYDSGDPEIDSQLNRYATTYGVFNAVMNYMKTGEYQSPFGPHDFTCHQLILTCIGYPEVTAEYLSTFNAAWYYTFDEWNENYRYDHFDHSLNSWGKITCYENHIAQCQDAVSSFYNAGVMPFGLNGTIFENRRYDLCFNNIIGANAFLNIFGAYCWDNKIGVVSFSNVFGSGCKNNTLLYNCTSNVFGSGSGENLLFHECEGNTFGGSFYYNIIKEYSKNNYFGYSCTRNVIGTYCQNNIFGSYCSENIFGSSCSGNSINTNCHSNSFGNSCSYNTLGNGCGNNVFSDSFSNNNFSDISFSFFGLNCQNCNSDDAILGMVVGAMCYSINIVASRVGLIQNVRISGGIRSDSEMRPIIITIDPELAYEICVGYNSNGILKTWCPADLVP